MKKNCSFTINFVGAFVTKILYVAFAFHYTQLVHIILFNLLRLQLVIVVAFNAFQVAWLVVDGLKGSHAAAREGACQEVLTQNRPCRTLRSVRGTFW